jgi:hypothetical protein
MRITQKTRKKAFIIFFILPIIFINFLWSNVASASMNITGLEFIGEASLPTGLIFQKTEIGGLSGITYDRKNDLYYAISDDRGQKAPPRFYTLKIDLSKGKLDKNNLSIVGVTTLLDENNQTYSAGLTDTEGIALTNKDTVFISSEGDTRQLINPFIKEFFLSTGKNLSTLTIPDKFLPDRNAKKGTRNNLGFESLTISPDNKSLFTASENALIQDGAAAKPGTGTRCRILQYNLETNRPEKEYLYQTEPVTQRINLTGQFSSGLPDLLALDNQGNLLSIERSFTGIGFGIFIFQVALANSDNISNIDSLTGRDLTKIKPAQKKLLLDLRNFDFALDNIEGLTLGPKLSDGQQSLILISDNNFNGLQRTQILAFKLKTESSLLRILRRIRILLP